MKDHSSNSCREIVGPSCSQCETYVNNTVFVDSQYGDDETALPELANRPARTIRAGFKLIKKTRKSEKQLWTMIIRQGKYILTPNQIFLPNVFVLGSGLGTKVYGEIRIIGNNELVGFQLFSNQFPGIHVFIAKRFINATVIFTELSIHLTAKSELANEPQIVGIIFSSRSMNTSVVIKNCIFDMNFDILREANIIGFLFPSSNIRIAFLTNTIQIFSHSSNGITVIENLEALTDFELGQIVINTSTNNIQKNIVYYSNASDQLMFIKDNRIVLTSTTVNSNPMPTTGPPYVIYYLAKNSAAIQSTNAVTNVLNIPVNRRMVAFVESSTAKITAQGLISLGIDVGNIGGDESIPNPRQNIGFSASADGNLQTSVGANGGRVELNDINIVSYIVTKPYSIIIVNILNADPGFNEEFDIQFPDPRLLGFTSIDSSPQIIVSNINKGVNRGIEVFVLVTEETGPVKYRLHNDTSVTAVIRELPIDRLVWLLIPPPAPISPPI